MYGAASSFAFANAIDTSGPFSFATQAQGRAALEAHDDFVERLSPFDRSARLKTDREVSERQYLDFVGNNVLAWDDNATKQRISHALVLIESRARDLAISLPKKIIIVRTTGQEEGGAAYTRGNAIVLPDTVLSDSSQDLTKVISHEIFHILSREKAGLRAVLYKTIGFEPCPEFAFPIELTNHKITNPDAPKNDFHIKIKYQGDSYWAVPVLYAAVAQYSPIKGGEFFDYLQFKLALTKGSETKFIGVDNVSGFFEQVGRNTDYIIHPEEILADNFALLILGKSDLPSPAIPEAMLKALKKLISP